METVDAIPARLHSSHWPHTQACAHVLTSVVQASAFRLDATGALHEGVGMRVISKPVARGGHARAFTLKSTIVAIIAVLDTRNDRSSCVTECLVWDASVIRSEGRKYDVWASVRVEPAAGADNGMHGHMGSRRHLLTRKFSRRWHP